MTEAKFPPNPYIIGSAINDPNKFFGRQKLFQFIETNLIQGVPVILLHGQRRVGKSSVLYQIPKSVFKDDEAYRNQFSFIFFDLQNKSNKSLAEILHNLATKILIDLKLNQDRAIVPTQEDLADNIDIFARRFLPQIYQELGNTNIVLLLDEFDVVSEENSHQNYRNQIEKKGGGFFRYLQLLLSNQQKLFIIPVIGRHLDEMPKLRTLFKGAPSQNIGLLDEDEAKELITKPLTGVIEYKEDVIQAILNLSAGHPYFTQIICFNLFIQARYNNNPQITIEDVNNIVEKAIESAEAGLDWFWNGLSLPEQLIFLAVANAAFPEDPFTVLRRNGVIEVEPLIQAAEKLVDQGFVIKPIAIADYTQSQVTVEFVRRWLLQRHPLYTEIWELEKLEAATVKIRRDAAQTYQEEGNYQRALELYEDVLKINPNHFSTILDLAEGYSKLGNFDKSLEYYTRAYQFDPLRNTKTLVRELEKYGHNLFLQRNFIKAKQQYQQVLAIQPRRIQSQQRLKEIEALDSQLTWRCEGYIDEPHTLQIINLGQECPICNRTHNSSEYSRNYTINAQSNQWLLRRIHLDKIAILVVGIVALFGLAFVVNRLSSACPAGEKKESAILCVVDMSRISRGERTFFSKTPNKNRDLGIEAYKQGNYPDATKFFASAVKNASNDPELLIYYNNALAHSKGLPITLAVIVPIDNAENKAKEILRGVAQAQDQFNRPNNNSGLNGQLLEIAIANDGNQEKDKQSSTSKQIAQVVVKDKNILGVIGHNSSDATEAALPQYEQAKLPVISPTSTSIYLNSQVFFRTVPSDAASGRKLADYAIKSGLKKVVIFSNKESRYSLSLRESFKTNFERLGGEVIAQGKPVELNDEPKLEGGNAISRSIFRYDAQAAVLFPDASSTPQALKVARRNAEFAQNPNTSNRKLQLLGGDTLYSQEILTQGKEAVEGLVLAVPWFREAPQSTKFAQAAAQQWGGGASWRTATSFDATQAFIAALKTAASSNFSRDEVLEALRRVNLSENETSGEALKFTPDGERQSQPVLLQVKQGIFTIVP
jgi:ABC-type branched-subunit amino acid transport system substrate-binding protein